MRNTLLMIGCLSLIGCATTPSFDEDAFASGAIRFDCRRPTCADRFRQQQAELLATQKQHDWMSLAQKVFALGVDSRLSYYLLGRAAEGLDNTPAAIQYYQLSSETTSEIGKSAPIELPKAAWKRLDALKYNRRIVDDELIPAAGQTPPLAANSVNLQKVGNVFYVAAIINEIEHTRFVLDTGAEEGVITTELLRKLTDAGTISPNDIRQSGLYRTASGENGKAPRVNLKTLIIGGKTLHDVTCLVLDNFRVDLLLGQNALQKLGNFKFDYKNQRLILED